MNYDLQPLTTCFDINQLITVYHQTFDKNYKFKGEVHNFWEFVYVQKGSVGVTADTQIYDLCESQSILHPPGEFHSIWNTCTYGSKVFVISFTLSSSNASLKGFKPVLSNTTLDLINTLIKHTECLKTAYDAPLQKISLLVPDTVPNSYRHILKNTLELILLHILDTYTLSDAFESSPTKDPDRALYTTITNYIHTNLLFPLDIQTLCLHCQVSHGTLKRLFKKFAGMGTMAYVNELKLNYAMKRLEEGFSINAISDELSFSSQHYFTYFFKQKTGLTPSQYKSNFTKLD